jgi:aspartyl-tRNA(Asn)/glutamyl-tRNA(Gln) amidotransferase subunit A
MSAPEAPGWIVDRLRRNLRDAGIPLDEHDLERILETGLLRTALAFEALDTEGPGDGLPDYLAARAAAEPRAQPQAGPAVPLAGGARDDSIATVAVGIRGRRVSPVELAGRALDRIAARDSELNAFQLVLAASARTSARAAEREIAAGGCRGPLHGVPVAVKDLLALAGTPTTAGSKILGGRVSDVTAAAVERLQEAGAVIVGKTRLAEFAYSPGSNNPHFGPTRNPHDPTRDSGGSSSGSGAAVAAGMVFAALGSDTGGSIRIPASLCGIVGLKPTFGRVSLDGAVPLSWSLDHIGPMTRTVADAALMLQVLAGHDARDPRSRPAPVPTYSEGLGAGVRGLRIGVVGDDGAAEPLGTREAEDAWRAGLAGLASAGASLVPIDLPLMAELRVVNGALLAMEAATFHRRWLRERSSDYGEFARLRLLSAHAYAPGAFIRAQQARAGLRAHMDALFARIDLLSLPSMPEPAPPLGVPASTRFTAPFNLLGWPAISVPVGRTEDGLPLGLQLVGRPWDETTVLRAARVVEGSTARAG